MNTLPTVASLCCGTGTGEVAAKTFFSTTLAVDNSWVARCSYMANHPGVMVVCEDIRNPHLISAAKQKYGEIDGIISSTPCIMFSTANSTSAEEKALNENSTLYLSPLEWIEAFKPRFYISENVPEVRKSPLFLSKLARLERLGYRWDCFILDAADFGTPQHRARLFLVAVRGDIPLPLPPKPTHGDEDQRRADRKLLPYRTLKDAIYDLFAMELEAVRSGRHEEFLKHEMMGCAPLSDDRTWVLSHVPPGGNYMYLPEDVKRQVVEALQRKGKDPFAGLCSRLPWGITPGTLRTGPNCQQMTMPIHPGVDVNALRKAAFWARRPRWIDPSNVLAANPDGDKSCLIVPGYDANDAGTILVTRCLAVREFQRLMGLPDDFNVLGNTTERYRQLGNGIAVQPMEALCRAVADALDHQSNLNATASADSYVPIESSIDSLKASAEVVPDEVKSFSNPAETSNPGKTAMQGVLSHPFATAAPGANNFAHLFDREHQTAMIQSAIDAAKASGFENRFHCLLFGPPGCGKTDILKSFANELGHDQILKFDATDTTQSGAVDFLLETAKLPPFLFIEEIEKVGENSLRWLLGVLDHRAEVRKLNFNSGLATAETKVLCLATANDIEKFEKLLSGALASRFAHKIHCPRPDRSILERILLREIRKVNGNPEWAKPTLNHCLGTEQRDDPRRLISVCLSGREKLLTGEFQRHLVATNCDPAMKRTRKS